MVGTRDNLVRTKPAGKGAKPASNRLKLCSRRTALSAGTRRRLVCPASSPVTARDKTGCICSSLGTCGAVNVAMFRTSCAVWVRIVPLPIHSCFIDGCWMIVNSVVCRINGDILFAALKKYRLCPRYRRTSHQHRQNDTGNPAFDSHAACLLKTGKRRVTRYSELRWPR